MTAPEFTGNLQFSGYILKSVAAAYQVKLEGLKLSFEELTALANSGPAVIVNIEDRHFIAVTRVADGLVHFMENGYSRTQSLVEFRARWYGVALVKQGYNPSLLTAGQDHSMTTQELLKVKGAGWFSKLFKKIVKIFQQIFQAVAKAVQKITAAVTKALTAVFGKTIGNMLASTVLAPLQFIGNTSYYLGQGDFKGLMKYWGQVALQVVIQVVVAIIAPYLLGALAFILGALMQGIGMAIGFVGSMIGSVVGAIAPGIGSAIGGMVQALGQVIINAGQALVIYGSKLMDGAASAFGKLSEGLKKAFDNVINPVTSYTNMFNNFSQTLGGLNTISGLSKFIENGMLQFGLQVAKDSIDNRIEKSKMSAFAKSILTTVTSAGLDSIGNLYMDARYPTSAQTVPEAAGARGPPTGLAGLLESVKNLGRSLQGLASTALKDAGGTIRSIFISGNNSDLSPNAKVTFGINGNPEYYIPENPDGASISNNLTQIEGGHYRVIDDSGNITNIQFDSSNQQVLSNETIGNYNDITNLSYGSLTPGELAYFDSLNTGNTSSGFPWSSLSDPLSMEQNLFSGNSTLTQSILSSIAGINPLAGSLINGAIAEGQLISDRYNFYRNDLGYSSWGAAGTTLGLTAGDFVGTTPLLEAIYGVNTTGQLLSGDERAWKAGEGILSLGLTFTGGFGSAKAAEQAAIRARVLSNIEASQVASDASKIGALFDYEKILSARNKQLATKGYNADVFGVVPLKKGDIVYGGLLGQGEWYTNLDTVKASGLNKTKLWELTQVGPHDIHPPRSYVAAYRVLEDIRVPGGAPLANTQFGQGNGFQYQIKNYKKHLEEIRRFRLHD